MLNCKYVFDKSGNIILGLGDTATVVSTHPVDAGTTFEVDSIHQWTKGKTVAIYGVTSDGNRIGPIGPHDLVWDI